MFPSKFNNPQASLLKPNEIHAMLSKEEQLMVDFVR
jgi:hypothetical protein